MSHDPQGYNVDTPLIYFGESARPGIYLYWDQMYSGAVATYDIQRADYHDGTYASIASVTAPTREYVDDDGQPNHYYKIRARNSSGAELAVSGPLRGEGLLIMASLAWEVKDLLRVRVIDEPAIFNRDRTQAKFSFFSWNPLPAPELRISTDNSDGASEAMQVMSETSSIYRTYGETDNYPDGLRYRLDWQGRAYFVNDSGVSVSIDAYDYIRASYSVKVFSAEQMNNALTMAWKTIKGLPGVPKPASISDSPTWWDPAIVSGAAYWLLRSLLVGLTQREKRLLLEDPDARIFGDLKDVAEMYKAAFDEELKKLPISKYPSTLAVITPEFYLPGGRSRFFRYVWKGGA